MIPPSWPFAVWGVDILGPFPRAVGGYQFLYIAIDKFTKWPEVVAFLKSIVCRYSVPNRIIADNGTQLLSIETHRRAATGNTKSREVAGALVGTAPSSTARNFRHVPGECVKAGRAT